MGRKALKRLRKRKLKKSVKRPPDDTLTQEREKYSKKTKEIQNQIDTQKMKNENTAKR